MKRNRKILSVLLAALLLCQLLSGCGSEPAEPAPVDEPSATEEVVEAEPTEAPEENYDISAFIGCWKYDDAPFYYVIGDEGEWMAINAYGDTLGPNKCAGSENGLELYDEHDQVLTVFTSPINGRSMDTNGAVLSSMDYIMLLPTPEDELLQTIAFPGDFAGISVNYPITMNAKKHPTLSAGLSFNAEMEDGTDDIFANITASFQPASGYDNYMTQGSATATKYMRIMLEQLSSSMYGDYLLKTIGSEVKDCGSYYSIVGYLWLDGSVFLNTAADTPVRATMEIRYYGPFGYVLVTTAIALENRIENYYRIACKIADSCTIDTGWSTAPKPIPADAGSRKSQFSGGSDSGDYGTPYYWYDSDGDVWYWNGYEDEFIGFGNDYYIEDGQFYESNDAGWDYDDSDWYYYDDDYDIWSDPGDGADAWSDPGDYYDDGWGDYWYD